MDTNSYTANRRGRAAVVAVSITIGIILASLLSYKVGQASRRMVPETDLQAIRMDTGGSVVTARNEQKQAAASMLPPPVMTPGLARQRMQERAAELDQNFREDPVTFGWSIPMEAKINKIIGDSGYMGEKGYGISSRTVECRTHGCSISMTFPNDELTDEATTLVRSELVDDFNQALTVPISHPDGSIEYRIYAVAPGNERMLRKNHQATVQSADQLTSRSR